MKENISLHFGQAGIGLGEACWEQYCLEHGVGLDGSSIDLKLQDNGGFGDWFETGSDERNRPRSIFVDLEENATNELQKGVCKDLISPDQIISGISSESQWIYAVGKLGLGARDVKERTLSRIRLEAEACDNLQGFVLTYSTGGSAAGLVSEIAERICVDYRRKMKVAIPIYPARSRRKTLRSPVVEPYNTVLSTSDMLDLSDFTIVLDNEKLSDYCTNFFVEPSRQNLNRLSSRAISSATRSTRFGDTHFQGVQAALIPFPRLQYLTCAYAPLQPFHEPLCPRLDVHDDVWQIVCDHLYQKPKRFTDLIENVCYPDCWMSTNETTDEKFMGLQLGIQGPHVDSKHIAQATEIITKHENMRFVEWCPTGFQTEMHQKECCYVDRNRVIEDPTTEVSFLGNHTGINKMMKECIKQFDCLFSQQAFTYHYAQEGYDIGEFHEARENLGFLDADYRDVLEQMESESDTGEEYY